MFMSLKKAIGLGLVLLVLLSGGVSVAAQDATPGAGKKVTKVAVVTPASRTNQGWDQQAADGMEAVGKERGIDVEIAENAGYDDITPILKDLADGGAQLIVCHGGVPNNLSRIRGRRKCARSGHGEPEGSHAAGQRF